MFKGTGRVPRLFLDISYDHRGLLTILLVSRPAFLPVTLAGIGLVEKFFLSQFFEKTVETRLFSTAVT